MDDKTALVKTAVGRRLIAYLTIVNGSDQERLRVFIGDNFTDEALTEQSVEERLRWHQSIREQTGKLRVYQVLASDDHHVLVVVEAQKDGGLYLNELEVTEDYPHKIIHFEHKPLEEVEPESQTDER